MMDVWKILETLEANETTYGEIGLELIRRLESLGVTDSAVAVSCLHDKSAFVVYQPSHSFSVMNESDTEWTSLFPERAGRNPRLVLNIDLDALDELKSFSPRVLLSGKVGSEKHLRLELRTLEAILRNYCLASIRRHRAMIRRSFIEAKVGSNDLGTFCYRLLNEHLPSTLWVEAASIFVFDKLTDELRLRGQIPPRTDGRHLADITVGHGSKSWIEKSFRENSPVAECNLYRGLQSGATIERVALKAYSRLYWPIRIQFRGASATQKRMKDPVIGVIRLSNIADTLGGWPRPFHCFDAFAVEFIAESLHNIIGSFVDRDVEGFNRDLAFHGAKTPAAGCLRNLKLAAQLLFDPSDVTFLQAKPDAVPRQFEIKKVGLFTRDELIRAFNNAYAFALNISAQIERANITEEFYHTPGQRVDSLFADVIQLAINLVPYFEISHSISGHTGGAPRMLIGRIFDLPLPPPVVGEEGALTSVFNNILENSIKYSRREGQPRVDFSWKHDGDFICISVRDNGIGIPEEDSQRIFTSTVRSERARQHTVRGDGLGLAYCSRVIRAFGGTISAIPLKEGLEIQVRLKKAQDK